MPIIFHEGDISRLPDKILKKYGFKKWPQNRDGFTHGAQVILGNYLLYDTTGFLTWKMKRSPKEKPIFSILIPEPIRTEPDLVRIMDRIRSKYA